MREPVKLHAISTIGQKIKEASNRVIIPVGDIEVPSRTYAKDKEITDTYNEKI